MLKGFAKYIRPHRGLFFLDLFCALLVGVADEFMPMMVRQMINTYVPDQNWQMMVRICIALAAIYLVKAWPESDHQLLGTYLRHPSAGRYAP
jgi:ATP-binding cassette subfamily B protein